MKNSIFKIIPFLLVLTLILSVFISCAKTDTSVTNNNSGASETSAAVSQDAGQPVSATEAKLEPNVPDEDYGGYTFTFLAHLYDGGDWVSPTPLELVAQTDGASGKEVENGEPVNDAVYKRNLKIEEKYNIKIKMIPDANEQSAMKKAVNSGDSTYDAAVMFGNNIPGIVTSGVLTNVANLPYVDLSKPWWDPAVTALSVDHKNYLLGGDLLILDNEATNALLFNKDLMAKLGIDLPYNLVKEGKWTMDAMNNMIKGTAADLNGDGAMTAYEDRWGFCIFNDTFHALLVSGGGSIAAKDKDDMPYIDFTSQKNLAILDKVMNLLYNPEYIINVQNPPKGGASGSSGMSIYHAGFEENRILFLWIRMRVVELFRDMDANFGIIPLPKYDENQAQYYSVVNPWTNALLGVPKSAGDLERDSIILEALAAESRYTLQPAYYDVVLTRKYARDAESEDMLDIIFKSRVYDIGAVYSFGNVFSNFNDIGKALDRNIVSYYDKNIGKMNKAIDKVVATFQAMD